MVYLVVQVVLFGDDTPEVTGGPLPLRNLSELCTGSFGTALPSYLLSPLSVGLVGLPGIVSRQ